MKSSEQGKKEALMRVPELRFPEFRDKKEWQENAISDLFNLKKKSEKVGNFDKEKVITVKLHANGVVKNERNGALTGGANYFIRHAGQFVFSKIDLLNGAFGLIPSELDGFCTSSDVPAFYFKKKESALFFINWLKANYRKIKIERTGTSSTLKRISVDKLLSMPIPLPDLQEQQKIANCLSSLDNVILLQMRKIDALQQYKKGLMQKLFPAEGETVPELRFSEFFDEKEWDSVSIDSKTTKVGSGITPKGGDKNYKNEGRPFIRSQNVGWGNLRLDDVVFIDDDIHSTFSSTEIKNGDVLLNITGASIGRSAVANNCIQGGNVNQHVCIIRTKKSELTPYFLNQYLLSSDGQKQIDSFQAGGNRQGLNFAQIRSFSLLLPSAKEQQKIADCLSSLDELITNETQKLATIKMHKTGLMQQLFPAMDEVNA